MVHNQLLKEGVASLAASVLDRKDGTYVLSVKPEKNGEHSLSGEISCLL